MKKILVLLITITLLVGCTKEEKKDEKVDIFIKNDMIFQVNKELDVIEPALEQALSILKVGGRVAVITFHSLEDRLVKNFFKEKCAIDERLKGMPNIPEEYLPDFNLVVNKAISPTEEELENNPRARSAKLRVIERIK